MIEQNPLSMSKVKIFLSACVLKMLMLTQSYIIAHYVRTRTKIGRAVHSMLYT